MSTPAFRGLATGMLVAFAPIAFAAPESATRAVIDGIVFFGTLFVLLIVAAALRLRDARLGLGDDEKKARLKRRLPWVMGVFFGACAYIMFRSL